MDNTELLHSLKATITSKFYKYYVKTNSLGVEYENISKRIISNFGLKYKGIANLILINVLRNIFLSFSQDKYN